MAMHGRVQIAPAWPLNVGRVAVAASHLPAAPVLTWTSDETDNAPNFDVDLPSGLGAPDDAEAGDIIYLEVSDNISFTSTSTETLDAGEVTGDVVPMEATTLADGTYYARARLKRGAAYGPYSNVETKTIDAPEPSLTTTWNSSAKSASIGLSGSDLIAAYITGANAFASVKAIAGHSTGLYFYQAVLGGGISSLVQVGIGNATASVDNFIGSDTNSVGWVVNSGTVYLGGDGFASIQTAAEGNTLNIAVNLTTMRIWFRTNTGDWNNDPTANPATGVGGLDISGMAAGPYFPMFAGFRIPDQTTANFGGSAYSPAAPSDFLNW